MAKSEDDFWNTSSSSGFNFDDDDDFDSGSGQGTSTAPDQNTVFRVLTETQLPIHVLISKQSLKIVLDDVTSTLPSTCPSVDDTIKKMSLGHNYNLSFYTKFSDKVKLLEKALESCDANIIIKVILYLKATLKANIFYHLLRKKKAAVGHYAYYLLIRNRLDEMADLYMVTGNTSSMKFLYYLTGRGIVSKSTLHRKLEQFIMEHLQKLNSYDDRIELNDNLQLLTFQIDNKFNSKSVICQLSELCKYDLANHKGLDRINAFKKLFKIDEFTFDWTLMNALASMQLWMHINDHFIKTNWLTKKNGLKTAIPTEVFLNGLSRHDPPKDILETMLGCISDHDKAFRIALKLQCHNFIIHHYVNQRDRLALLKYKEKVAPQSSAYFLIESSLQSSDKKWKN